MKKKILKGKVVLDKDAGAEVARGLSNLGSNIGLGACVGALAGGVAKCVAKSSLPPFQKAGLVVVSGIAGAVLHTGASAINAQTHAASSKSSGSTGQTVLPKDVNQFIGSLDDLAPLEILLQCIYILNSLCIWLILILSMQIFFKVYIGDKPELKLIDYILPSNSDKIKVYIYKLIKLNKNMSIIYTILTLILLLICILASAYFSW